MCIGHETRDCETRDFINGLASRVPKSRVKKKDYEDVREITHPNIDGLRSVGLRQPGEADGAGTSLI